MNEITLSPKVDEHGTYREGMLVYFIQDRCDWGRFVPAKVLEDCRRHGSSYLCLVIPGACSDVIIELGEL